MLSRKERIDRNYDIINAFAKRYPEELKEMISDLEMVAGPFKACGSHPADQWVLDDGVADNMAQVLRGETTIEENMAAWKLAVFQVLMAKLTATP